MRALVREAIERHISTRQMEVIEAAEAVGTGRCYAMAETAQAATEAMIGASCGEGNGAVLKGRAVT